MNKFTALMTTLVAAGSMVMTTAAPAQSVRDLENLIKHRSKKEGEWRNLGYAGAGLAALGILTKNNILTYAGVGGGLYSLYRMEQDKKSRHASERRRAAFYSAPTRWYKGKKYKRVTVTKNGKKYYAYKRA